MSFYSVLDAALRAEPTATLAKATAILVLATIGAIVAGGASAAIRHLIWLLALAACGLLVVLGPLAPRIPLAVDRSEPLVERRGTSTPRSDVAPKFAARRVDGAPRQLSPTMTERSSARVARRTTSSASTTGNAPNAMVFVLAIWALGCLAVLARCAGGHRAVFRLMKGARVADSIGWSNILESLARDQRIRRHIRLALNDELEAPITAGWINPVILLPCDADTWTPERKHVVLVHELAHVARGDYAAQLVATFVLAVLWFHPLVWLAVARLRTEAEQAADDRVLASGVAGVNYATHLLEIARSASRIQLAAAVAVGMARSSRMERRFRSMLDPRRSRRALRGRTFTLAALASMSVVAPLACVRTVARATPKLANDARTERVVTAALSSPSVPEPPSPNATAPSARPSLPRSTDDRTSASDSIVDKTIDAASGGRVRLVLPTGGGVIVHGWDSSRVRVRTELGGSDWRLVRIALDRTGGDVRVRSTFVDAGTHSTELWFEIWIPRRSDVDLASAGGSVEIDDVNGKLVGETGGGSIVIRHAKGFASLSTGGGEIDVSESDLGGQVSTGWGPIYLRNVTGGLSGVSPSSRYVSSTSAATWPAPFTSVSSVASNRSPTTTNSTIGSCVAVSVGSPSVMTTTRDDTAGPRLRATGPLTLVKPGGSIDIASAPSGATLSTGGGHIVVEQSNKTVVASTGGGDIQLLRASGDATASTGAGDVTISVVNTDGAMHDINVCDGHGRVILELPAELDATLELETAYTDQFGRRTNIESDVPVERSETTEWDDRYGTPRKFVRAVGKSGSGAGMIRVHTVNGDIVVRRR